jgi:hypothetical protein
MRYGSFLLNFKVSRSRVHDESGDFDYKASVDDKWLSVEERATAHNVINLILTTRGVQRLKNWRSDRDRAAYSTLTLKRIASRISPLIR